MFKKGHVPDKVGPTPPHRQPFENFVNKVVEEYTFRGDETWVCLLYTSDAADD